MKFVDLVTIDTQVFLLINHLPHNTLLNALSLGLSAIGTAGIIWLILGGILFVHEETKDHRFFAPILLSAGASWILVEKILKPWVARSRPALEIGAILVGDGRTDFSFPSGHATISWALAVVLSRKEPRWKWMFYTLAVLISLSRIYLGVHYPLDVAAGTLFGWGIGSLALHLSLQKSQKKGV
ncbi:MAG: phosphatase PAP2 family protein [Patescibacteria group bacterium]